MNAVTDQIQQRFSDTRNTLPGSQASWVRALREGAMKSFVRDGFPTTRHEAWKYTDIRKYLERFVSGSEPSCTTVSSDTLAEFSFGGLDCHRLVFVDGRFSSGLSDMAGLPDNVQIGSMADVLSENPDAIEAYLHNGHLSGSFAELNNALMHDGVVVEIPDGTILEKPVQLLYLSSGEGQQAQHIRNLLIFGENSRATVIEHYVSAAEGNAIINVVSDVELHAGSYLEHYKLQLSAQTEVNIGSVRAHQHRDSYYHSYSVAMGAALSRRDIHVEINGEGAECALNGLYLVGGRQHVDHHTRIDHLRPNCRSRESYKGVVDGRARAVFNGKVIVHKGADGTDSAQSNANLLLSDKAEVDTKPDLEIYADDVKCAHGATVGQLDMNQLFYLRSRGLSLEQARNVLMFAFADEVLAEIGVPQVRKYLEQIAFEKLPHDTGLDGLLG